MIPQPPPLESALGELLDDERQAVAPPDALGRVWERVAALPVAPGGRPPRTSTASTSWLRAAVASQGFGVLLGAAVALGAGVGLHSWLRPTPPARVVSVDRPLPTAAAVESPAVAPPMVAPVGVELPPAAHRPEIVAAPQPVRPPAAVRAAPPHHDDSTLGDERAILDQARSLLGLGDGAAALRLTDDYTRRFARPQLGEECEAIAIQALVVAGRYADARARAARFEASSPSSLFRPAVAAAVGSIP